MKRIIIYPYKLYSESAKTLVEHLEYSIGRWVRRISGTGKFKPKESDVIINWGNSTVPNCGALGIINDPNAVAIAINKIDSFRMFDIHGVTCPEWSTEYEKALEWTREGQMVFCRNLLSSSGGRGIIIVGGNNDASGAPLYVKYKKKRKEFRVHVFNGEVIEVAEKRKRGGFDSQDPFNFYVRNWENGWVFCCQNVVEPANLRPLALKAVNAVGLNFGAVDIIWNEFENMCYALEVNTAPGVDNRTAKAYAEAILKLC